MTLLVALAGPSRSGKGTTAQVFAEEAAKAGLTSFERQLSDNGKWSLAHIFHPTITRVEAVEFFEALKEIDQVEINISMKKSEDREIFFNVPLQKFIQHGLQEGHRDIYGADFWIDMIIPYRVGDKVRWWSGPDWFEGFFDVESKTSPTDLAIISDLRQANEAERVRSLDGIVIHLRRPTNVDEYRTGLDHTTERELSSEFDYTIVNDGSVDHLRESARLIFHNIVLPLLERS